MSMTTPRVPLTSEIGRPSPAPCRCTRSRLRREAARCSPSPRSCGKRKLWLSPVNSSSGAIRCLPVLRKELRRHNIDSLRHLLASGLLLRIAFLLKLPLHPFSVRPPHFALQDALCLLAHDAEAKLPKQPSEFGVLLAKNLLERDRMVDDVGPVLGVEGELLSLLQANWRKLEEITAQNHLEPPCASIATSDTGGRPRTQRVDVGLPNGLEFLRTLLARSATLSNRAALSIEISSTTRQAQWRHLSRWPFCSLLYMASIVPLPKPMPAKLCNVMPPMLQAAIPVGAVKKISSLRSQWR
eukprot:scaffold7506_cov286-Pinguiococcus_pyrenoidosus.AAC.11